MRNPEHTTPSCKKCGSHRTGRKHRKGFFQTKIMFKLGYFPWECHSCWKTFFSRVRVHRGRRGSRLTPNEDEATVGHLA